MSWWIERARASVRQLAHYKPAVWDKQLERLNANENPWPPLGDTTQAGLQHYPEPYPESIAHRLAQLYDVPESNLIVTRGADDAIDLLVRTYVAEPHDAVLICPPTFAMYEYATLVQGGQVQRVPLLAGQLGLDLAQLATAISAATKLIMLCSPNNPTGNRLSQQEIVAVLAKAEGKALVVVDEAYVDFAQAPALTALIARYPGLVLLRTLSKSYSLAGARCGAVIAHADIIDLLKRVLPPYSMSTGSIEAILTALTPAGVTLAQQRIAAICAQRDQLALELADCPLIDAVLPSEANFVAVISSQPATLCERAKRRGLLIRSFDQQRIIPGLVRISIGTPAQNSRLLEALRHG
jgi:histidinol-phosphate aminotransferase